MNNKRSITQAAENLIRGNTSDAVPRITEQKRIGRPTNEARHIALLAQFHMSRLEISGEVSVKRRRVIAAKVMGFGNTNSNTEDQERNARRDIAKALKHLRGCWDTIVFAGNEHGEGRTWIALQCEHEGRKSVIQHYGDGLVSVNGFGWLCEWGERLARYGLIQSTKHRGEPNTSEITVSQGPREGVKK